jgi:hypothetical protein
MSEPDEPRGFGVSLNDIVVIGLAALFALCGFYLMFGPSPLAPLFEARKHQAATVETPAAEPAETAPAAEPGEVSIDLKTYKPPPQE